MLIYLAGLVSKFWSVFIYIITLCIDSEGSGKTKSAHMTGFYTKLNVWGSLGLNFAYDGGPIIENGGPIFLYRRRILGGSKSFREAIRTGLTGSCQTGVSKHQVIFTSQPFVAT